MDESARLLPVWDLKSLSQRGLNHLSSGRLSRAMSGLSYQSIDVAPALLVALGGRCSRRPASSPWGILMGMQIAFGLATSADIDPPADFYSGDRWTVTSEWEEIGTHPPHMSLSGVQSLPLFCSPLCVTLHPSLISVFISSPVSIVIPPFLFPLLQWKSMP